MIIFSLLSSFQMNAQEERLVLLDAKITEVENQGKKIPIATFIALEDNVIQDTTVTTNGRAYYPMKPYHIYKFFFKKEGYVTKFLIVDTHDIPSDDKVKKKLKVDISLFIDQKGLDADFLQKEAMGVASYDYVRKKLAWNETYTDLMVEKIIEATLKYTEEKEKALINKDQ